MTPSVLASFPASRRYWLKYWINIFFRSACVGRWKCMDSSMRSVTAVSKSSGLRAHSHKTTTVTKAPKPRMDHTQKVEELHTVTILNHTFTAKHRITDTHVRGQHAAAPTRTGWSPGPS